MTDEILIHNYLDRFYVMATGGDNFYIYDIDDSLQPIRIPVFKKNIFETIFGDYTTDKNINSFKVLGDWVLEKKNALTSEVYEFFENLEINKGSSVLGDEVIKHFGKHKKLAPSFLENIFNEWYREKVIDPKINDLLSQLVITLGRSDWVVTWIGHGPINDNTLRNIFKKENNYQFIFIKGAYDEWYEEEVINRSERIIKHKLNNIY